MKAPRMTFVCQFHGWRAFSFAQHSESTTAVLCVGLVTLAYIPFSIEDIFKQNAGGRR